jgi:hypothetical protein
MLTRFGLVSAALVAGAGCFTSTADFREEAETFITDEVAIPGEPDLSFESVTCEEPPRQDPGTVFGCTATDNQGATWTFDVTIEEDNQILVSVDQRP